MVEFIGVERSATMWLHIKNSSNCLNNANVVKGLLSEQIHPEHQSKAETNTSRPLCDLEVTVSFVDF
jgi:hypothetical protein